MDKKKKKKYLYGIFGIIWIMLAVMVFLYLDNEIAKILFIFVASMLASYYITTAVKY